MCTGLEPEVIAALTAAAESAPEAAAAGTAAAGSAAASVPGMVAPGMASAAALDSGLINAGMPQLAGGAFTKAAGLLGGDSLMAGLSGGGSKAASGLLSNMGMSMMQPHNQQMPMGGRPAPQGPQGPLPNPYRNDALSGNMPPPGMSFEEWLRRKQMMGGQGV